MIIVGNYYTQDVLEEWYFRALPLAKEAIMDYPLLNRIFNNFSEYETRKSENRILYLCLPKISGEINEYNKNILQYIEDALNHIKFENWVRRKKNSFISKLTSDDINISSSPYDELLFYYFLLMNDYIKDIEFYPIIKNEISSDIKIMVNNTEIYIEIGSLGKNLPTRIIENMLNKSAEYFGQKYQKQNGHIKFDIDTANLIRDSEGRIKIDDSVSLICEEMDRLNIYSLMPFNNYIYLKDVLDYLGNEELFKPIIQDTNLFPSLKEVIKYNNINKWLDVNKNELLKGFNLITTFYMNVLDHIFVEIHTEYQTPSKASILIRESFINHLKRHITEQSYQIKENKPNIIAINAEHLNMFILGSKYIHDASLVYELRKFLIENNMVHLSGVLLYDDYGKILFIQNQIALDQTKLKKSILHKIGIKNIF